MDHGKIIVSLGDYREVAADLDLHPTTVYKWWRDGIPARRWQTIVDLAQKKGKSKITLNSLSRGATR